MNLCNFPLNISDGGYWWVTKNMEIETMVKGLVGPNTPNIHFYTCCS